MANDRDRWSRVISLKPVIMCLRGGGEEEERIYTLK